MDKAFDLEEGHFLFSSESVTIGHPDKLCDYISDSVVDACLEQDPFSVTGCNSSCRSNIFMLFGEVSSKAQINLEQTVRNAIAEVGYDNIDKGADHKTCSVFVAIVPQSQEIAQAVYLNKREEDTAAGDQGLMIGYACNETESLMPLSHDLAQKLCRKLYDLRMNKALPWLRPDAKSQVTIEYKKQGVDLIPLRVHTVVISTQHSPEITKEEITAQIKEQVIDEVIPSKYLDEKTKYHINPSGSFILGGPAADSGLTGRKIIVDTYGGWGGHGGGAFSGKDPTKVDRSANYAARWVAKSLVANKFCDRAMVQIAYGIGIADPISVYVDSYGTCAKGYTDVDLQKIVMENFNLKPGAIIRDLQLRRPIYKKLAAFGHFGREDLELTWEKPKDLTHAKKF